MLYGAVKHLRPENVLELGTAVGYSASWILLALEENEHGHLYTVDLIPTDKPLWHQFSLPTTRLTYLSNEYIDGLRESDKIPKTFDLIFHDAGHNVAEVEKDLAWVLPRLNVGGSLVVHDTVYNPQIGESLRRFFEDPIRTDFWKFEEITEASGVGIATRLKGEETVPCVDESSGSTTQKDLALQKEKTAKITSATSPKSSKPLRAGKRSKKTKTLYSSRQMKQKGQELKQFASNGNGKESVNA